jgi:hypothetical protein
VARCKPEKEDVMGFLGNVGKKIANSASSYANQTLARLGIKKKEPGYAAMPGEKSAGMMKPRDPRMKRSMNAVQDKAQLNRLGRRDA